MTIDALFEAGIYTTPQAEKSRLLGARLADLTRRHAAQCRPYRSILEAHGFDAHGGAMKPEDAPFVPVRLFKTHMLQSVTGDDVFKVLTSSGTTGQQVSRIVLDKATAQLQTRVMVSIMQHFIGTARLPMLIVDHASVVKDRSTFSARGAGILGMANFGRAHTYALRDEDMRLDLPALTAFLAKHGKGPVLLFGFTFMVWKYLVEALEASGRQLSLDQGILVHSGGWKKLEDQAVDNPTFKARLAAATGIKRVHNFYGMVEQVGSIFVECEHGRLHAPVMADVIIRRPRDWSVAAPGEEGLIQVVSGLPESYPGHSLLTEDRGTLTGEDDCPCGRKGRTFKVLGRLPKAEIRGCSDTHAAEAA